MKRFGTMGDGPGGVAAASAAQAAYIAATKPSVDQAQAAAQAATNAASQAAASADSAAKSLLALKARIQLGTINSDVANELSGIHYSVPVHQINNMIVPATQAAAVAGAKALANQLTLDYQAGNISKSQLDSALAQLKTAAQSSG